MVFVVLEKAAESFPEGFGRSFLTGLPAEQKHPALQHFQLTSFCTVTEEGLPLDQHLWKLFSCGFLETEKAFATFIS